MNLSPLYITFGQHQVVVETAIVDVHTTLKRWFYAMLELQPSLIVRQIKIWHSDGNYIRQSGDLVHESTAEQFCLLQSVKYEVVMALVSARPDLLWFHAGAVANDTEAVVFAAPRWRRAKVPWSRNCASKDGVTCPMMCYRWSYPPATFSLFLKHQEVRQNTGELVPSDRLWSVP